MSSLTLYAIRNTHYALRTLYLNLNFDTVLGLFLFLAGLYAYTVTLAPTVLEGDGALFQYTPYVLGVTYPTGFPLYILIGKLWLILFPFGSVAWRMNFLSALSSATALPLIYGATRRIFSLTPTPNDKNDHRTSLSLFYNVQGRTNLSLFYYIQRGSRWAALIAVLTFATLPTFWFWSTSTKTYALNILLFACTLYLLALALKKQTITQASPEPGRTVPKNRGIQSTSWPPRLRLDRVGDHLSQCLILNSPLLIPALLLGLQISVHNTAVLLIPGLLLLVWLQFRRYLGSLKSALIHLLLFGLPGLFYLYVPLRAEWLIARYGRQAAIERGLLADFYHSGWEGLLRYFTAADFTGGVVTNWSLVPQQFFTRYLPILTDNFTVLGVGLGLVGGIALAILKPRLFWPLFLIYAIPIPFVLAYGQGEQSAFLLPSFLIFSIFAGHTFNLIEQLLHFITNKSTLETTHHVSRITPPLLFTLLLIFLFLPQIRYNFNWLDVKWSRPIYEEWTDNLNHPLEPGATVLARWGDLTSFWYMQYAEERRPDLRGLYPPTEETVIAWFKRGGENLYIAGPLESWAGGVEKRYRLLPWGRLVRIAPRYREPETLLPNLAFNSEAIFDNKLRLIGFDYAPQVAHGSNYPVTLTWQALTDLPPETTISLRLSQGESIITQLDDTLLSGWFPRSTLPAGQHVLSYALLPIPLGTLPGKYNLQLVTYTNYKQPWPMPDDSTLLDLGEVEVVLPPADYRPKAEHFHTISGHDFNREIRLADYEYSVSRVGQGKGFAVKLLWQAIDQPVDNYTLLVEVVDASSNVIRAVERQPVAGQAPTSTWQSGQFVRDQVDLVLPASAPPGKDTINVRLSWLRSDGSKLNVRRWFIPFGEALDLDSLTVTEKRGRIYDIPEMQYPIDANLNNKARLLGYNSLSWPEAKVQLAPHFTISQAACQAKSENCQLELEFYWQGLAEMDELYTVFLHLVDAEDRIIAQHDRVPGIRGKQPTTGWLPGEIVADPIILSLPADLAPGQYTLRLGMYLPSDGSRLPLLDQARQIIADFIEVGTIRVMP